MRSRCALLLASGNTVSEVARIVGINASTLRKAVLNGRIVPALSDQVLEAPGGSESTKES